MTSAEPDEFELMRLASSRLGLEAQRQPVVDRFFDRHGGSTISGIAWGVEEPEVVLLHGGGQNAHTWDNVLFRLGRPAVAIDLPGHGHSSWYSLPDYRPDRMASDLAPVLRARAPSSRVVVGMSLGGFVAAELASNFPELVPHLVLVDVSPSSTPDRSRSITDFLAVDTFDSFDELVAHTRRFRPGIPEASLRRSLSYNARSLPDGRWTWRHDRRDTPQGDRQERMFASLAAAWDTIATVRCRITFVTGSDSAIVTADDVERFRLLQPDIRIIVIDGAGHNVQGDAPGEVCRVLRSVLDGPSSR